jgi:multicomponent Na+:H+ antiporter subunit D
VTSSAPAWIIAVPFFAAVLLPMVHRISRAWVHPLALVGSGAALIFALYAAASVVIHGGPVIHTLGGWAPPWGIELRVDYLSAVMVVLIAVLSFLVLLFGHQGLEARIRGRGHFYYAMYLLFTVGLFGMVLTHDLFNLYVFLEVSSLAGYALIAVGERASPFAAFRYLILGTLGAMLFLLGLGYLYGLTGTLNFLDMAERLSALEQSRAVLVALALVLTGFGLKAALFPLHAWLPDSYTYAPSVTVAFMAAVGTKVGAYGVFRILFTIYEVGTLELYRPVIEVMGWMSAVAILAGSILAMAQSDLKRMLAYSSVSQIGYVLLGFSFLNADGIVGGTLHIVNHAFMKCCLFLVVGALMARVGHRDIRRLTGMGRKMPWVMAAFSVAAISMVGLPPTAGFFSKWYLVLGAVEAGQWIFVGVILVSSLLNAAYFFRVLERVYLSRPDEETATAEETATDPEVQPWIATRLPASMLTPILVTSASLLVLGFASAPLVEHVLQFIVPPGL